MQAILNHIWQSTLFAAAAWLLTLALRRNRAQTRSWIWLAASAKFLVPFSLLMWMGSQVSWRTVIVEPAPNLPIAVEHDAQGFAAPAAKPSAAGPDVLPEAVTLIWACGFIAICFRWGRRWTRIQADARTAQVVDLEMDIEFPIPVKESASLREPGVRGVLRPVLLLPEGIADRLAPAQLRAILTHELSHVRRRDNLAMSMHAMAQALFWFHPMVWWIGVKLVEERERACDEAVLQSGSDPETYAEGILNVCKLYLAAPVECAAGVTGSNLNRRIEEIMTNRIKPGITGGKKVLLAVAGALTIAGPLAIGLWNAPPIRAQAIGGATPSFEVAAIRRLETVKAGGRAVPASQVHLVQLDTPGRPLRGISGNRFSVEFATLTNLVILAYDLRNFQVSGGPSWAQEGGDVYSVSAKAEGEATPTSDQVRRMLQTLLAERFQLKLHKEVKDFPVYHLMIGKSSPKLRETDKKRPASLPAMAMITGIIANFTDRPVIDKTGLTAQNYEFNWNQDDLLEELKTNGKPAPSIFKAVEEQLGLKLEPAKEPMEVLVIDHAERPMEN